MNQNVLKTANLIGHIDKIKKVEDVPQYELASRTKRLIASLIDASLYVLIYLIVVKLTFKLTDNGVFSLERIFKVAVTNVVFFLFNYSFLIKGQTIGKKLMKVRVVTLYNNVPSVFNLFFIRYLLFIIIGFLIGFYNYKLIHIDLLNYVGLIDFLIIFGCQRRCLHDYIAKTKVIKAN